MKAPKTPPAVLCLSGSDPSGGAGLEADLKTFHRHGVRGMALPTLLTVQNSRGVREVHFLDPNFLAKQWRALFADARPAAIKIGALGSRRMVLRVAGLLSSPEAKGIPVVLDPVLGSTAGVPLFEESGLALLVKRVFPLCRVVTPNVQEFTQLFDENFPASPKLDVAAASLRALGNRPYAILLKGGHLSGSESTDLLWEKGRLTRFTETRLPWSAHGTGCALASSIAAHLAWGRSLPSACRKAKAFVHAALAEATPIGPGSKGRRSLNLWA